MRSFGELGCDVLERAKAIVVAALPESREGKVEDRKFGMGRVWGQIYPRGDAAGSVSTKPGWGPRACKSRFPAGSWTKLSHARACPSRAPERPTGGERCQVEGCDSCWWYAVGRRQPVTDPIVWVERCWETNDQVQKR